MLTGNTKNMGGIPYAARDPLFWCHHISIDRMWASWNLNGGVNPSTASWATKTFVFIDGNGQRVVSRTKDFFDLATLGYTYDTFIPGAQASQTVKKASTLAAAIQAAAASPPMTGSDGTASPGTRNPSEST